MPSIEKRPRRAGIRPAAITGLAALLFGVGGGCALRTLLAPAPEVLDSPAYTLVAAQEGTVGHSLRLNTTAEWQAETTLLNQAAGIITSRVWQAGDTASAGSIIYTVDLRPVVVAAGDVPAFRDLHSGARGEDVTQLQELLVSTGNYAGAADGSSVTRPSARSVPGNAISVWSPTEWSGAATSCSYPRCRLAWRWSPTWSSGPPSVPVTLPSGC